jgi:hypothetical protein
MTLPFKNDETQGNQVETVPGQEQEPTTPIAGYVTIDEFKATIKSMEDKMSNWYRGIQSQTDNIDTRVQRRIEEYERAAASQGMKLTDSQKQQLTDQTTLEEIRAASSSATANGNPDPMKRDGETDEQFETRVNNAADTLLRAAGVTLEDGDPEVELINTAAAKGSAEEYLNAHTEAIRLKKARLAGGGQPVQSRSPEAAVPGAIPGSHTSNPIANITKPDELWEMAKKQGEV